MPGKVHFLWSTRWLFSRVFSLETVCKMSGSLFVKWSVKSQMQRRTRHSVPLIARKSVLKANSTLWFHLHSPWPVQNYFSFVKLKKFCFARIFSVTFYNYYNLITFSLRKRWGSLHHVTSLSDHLIITRSGAPAVWFDKQLYRPFLFQSAKTKRFRSFIHGYVETFILYNMTKIDLFTNKHR